MNISIITDKGRKVDIGRSLRSKNVLRSDKIHPSRRWFRLRRGALDPRGEEVLITGKEYVVFNRRYNLSSGYGILARVDNQFQLTPVLRQAVGRETSVFKDENGNDINGFWPIIRKI